MSGYFSQIRMDALALLPPGFRPTTILDVGCGEGSTGAYLKKKVAAAQVTGIEVNPAAAMIAWQKLDHVVEVSVESPELDLPLNHFCIILCLDVLEHLSDPWKTLSRLVTFLKDDGLVLISLPNIQNWRVVLNLLGGSWDYADSGIMDRTHLRFFTAKTAVKMIERAGLHVVRFRRSMGAEARVFNALTFGVFRSFLTFHLYFLARKVAC